MKLDAETAARIKALDPHGDFSEATPAEIIAEAEKDPAAVIRYLLDYIETITP